MPIDVMHTQHDVDVKEIGVWRERVDKARLGESNAQREMCCVCWCVCVGLPVDEKR